MSKIEKPGKGIGLREGTRLTLEGMAGSFPGGGGVTAIIRQALPSKLDKQESEWKHNVTDTINEHDEHIKRIYTILEQGSIGPTTIDNTNQHVILTGIMEGELTIYQDLVQEEKFQTVLDLLSKRFNSSNHLDQIPQELKARILSLKGVCLKSLGQLDEASKDFLEAFATDSDNPKIRNNAVVGYLIKKDIDTALALLEELIKNEPEEPMYWANMICARSHKGEVADLKKMPEVVQKDENVLLALINIKRQNDDFTWTQLALKTAKLYPESRRARRHGADAAIELAMASFVSDELPISEKTTILQKAEKAATELGEQLTYHLNAEVSKFLLDIDLLQNTLIAYHTTGNIVEFTTLIKTHKELLLSDNQGKKILGLYALENYDEALLNKVLKEDFPGSSIIRLEKAMRDMDWAKSLDICQKYQEEIASNGKIDPIFAADVFHAALLEGSEQKAEFEKVLSQKPQPDQKNDLLLYQLASSAGIQDVANTAFNRAATADIGTDAVLRRILAREAFNQNKYDLVICLLDTFVDSTRDDITRKWLAISYANTTKPYEIGITFFEGIMSAHNANAELSFMGGHFHLNRRQPDEAIPWFRRSLDIESTDVRTQLAYCQALNYSGKYGQAEDFLVTVDLSLAEGTVEDLINMAQLLWRNGRIEALEYAYQLAVRNRNNFEVCLKYSGLILASEFYKNVPQVPVIDEVSVGAMVRLGRIAHDDWIIVIDENESDIPEHIKSDNSIAQQSMGKNVGDEFEATSGPNNFTWTVKEVKSKYLHLFHEITEKLPNRFPDNDSFYWINIIDGNVTPILENVRAHSKSIEELDKNYRDQLIPLGAIANAKNISTIAFAIHLVKSDQKIFSATGYPQDTNREFITARSSQDRTIVLDAYTVWLLENLDILDIVKNVFPKLIIPASSFDEFEQMIDELSQNSDGQKIMITQGDGYMIHEFSAEKMTESISLLEATRQHISDICQISGIEVPAKMNGELLQMSEFLGNQFDCLSVILRENGVLLSADLRFRRITTEVCKEQAFGLDALLHVLLIEDALSIETHVDTLLKLCEHGHSYVFLNGRILLEMLVVDETINLERFKRAAIYLGEPNADIDKHILVTVDFIKRAFRYYRGGLKAQRATGIVLGCLLQINGIEITHIRDQLVSVVEDVKVRQYVEEWIKEHFQSISKSEKS